MSSYTRDNYYIGLSEIVLPNLGDSKGKASNTNEESDKKGIKRKGLIEEPTPKNVDMKNKRARKGDPRMSSEKVPGKKDSDNIDNERLLEKQSKALWDIKDNLKKHVDTSEMRLMLEENEQDASGSEYNLRERW